MAISPREKIISNLTQFDVQNRKKMKANAEKIPKVDSIGPYQLYINQAFSQL